MKYEYWMASLYKLSTNKRIRACKMAGSAHAFYEMNSKQIQDMHLFCPSDIVYITEAKAAWDIDEQWELFQKKNVQFIPFFDQNYPQKLLQIHQVPYALYVRGKLPDQEKKTVAIVGARMCTEYGRTIAKKLGEKLAGCDVQVISGMAVGVDSASHAGALSAGGKTFSVLGCGCDICYPRSSENIYRSILKTGGGILSELTPGTKPMPHFFPQRNRIISALSDIVVVVEAKERSGSLITADFALEQGKDIYAVPGRYGDTLSAGCNHLIEQGAGILYSIENFLKNTAIVDSANEKVDKTDHLPLEKEQMMVYSCLDLHPKFINLIIEETGLNLLAVLHAIEGLKRRHLVQESFQNYFCKTL